MPRPRTELTVERCAIVGGGLAGLVAYATLRHGGLEPGEITVLGTERDPAAAWARRAGAIRQRRMRSESDGHCLPTSFPGLAVREAVRRRNPVPLVASLLDRYHPTVPTSSITSRRSGNARAGTRALPAPNRTRAGARRRLLARRRGRLPARAGRAGPPGPEPPRSGPAATRARSTRMNRTTTPRPSRSWEPAWRRPPSG